MATRSGLLSKQELRQFVKEHNFESAEDIQRTLKELFADVLQEALEAELDTHLGYGKHDVKNKRETVVTAIVRKPSPPNTAM